jgi:NAD(P)H-quinone oxidoreductase subunit 4
LLFDKAFFGRLTTQTKVIPDTEFKVLPMVLWRDRTPSLILALAIVLFGLQPNWIAYWSETTTAAIVDVTTKIAGI